MSKKDSVDKDLDYLEEEFLKCNLEDIPIPIDKIEDLEEEVIEVMKSGCNRQIAEYVILKYTELEDDGDNKKKLIEYKKDYEKIKNEYFEEIKNKKNEIEGVKTYLSVNYKNNGNRDDYYDQLVNEKLGDIVDEVKKVTENYQNNDIKSGEYEKTIKYIIYKNMFIKDKKDNDEKAKKFFDEREKYIQKREAVIEACLRKVKKIVNDEKEYNEFYKEFKENMKNNE